MGSIVGNLYIPGTWKVGYFDCLLDQAWCVFLSPTVLCTWPPSSLLWPTSTSMFSSFYPSLYWNPSPYRILILKDLRWWLLPLYPSHRTNQNQNRCHLPRRKTQSSPNQRCPSLTLLNPRHLCHRQLSILVSAVSGLTPDIGISPIARTKSAEEEGWGTTSGRWDGEADGARGFGSRGCEGAYSEEAGCHTGLTSISTSRVDSEESEYGGGGGVGWHEKSK